MKIEHDGTENGIRYFNITDAGSMHLTKVREDIQKGDIFNIYYGESSKGGGIWLGKKNATAKQFMIDLENSLKASDVYKKEVTHIYCLVMDSDEILEGEDHLTLRQAEDRLSFHVGFDVDCYIGLSNDYQ